MKDIIIEQRKTAHVELFDFCVFENKEDGSYMEVTEWTNCEGYDVYVMRRTGEEKFSLTHGSADALIKIIKEMRK